MVGGSIFGIFVGVCSFSSKLSPNLSILCYVLSISRIKLVFVFGSRVFFLGGQTGMGKLLIFRLSSAISVFSGGWGVNAFFRQSSSNSMQMSFASQLSSHDSSRASSNLNASASNSSAVIISVVISGSRVSSAMFCTGVCG